MCHGVGKGRHALARKVTALGEAVERQHFEHSRAHRLCPLAELQGKVVNLERLGIAPGQSAHHCPDGQGDTIAIAWSLATDVATGEACWVPHESRGFIQSGYRPTTSGWAAHEMGRAELAALLELIERDAALLSWYSGDFGEEILGAADYVMDALRSHGFLVRLFLLSKDIRVPVVWAWARCTVRTMPVPYGASVMSAAAALMPEDAIRSAIDGIVQKLENVGPEPCVAFYGVPSNPREHVLHYLNEAAGQRLDVLLGSPPTLNASRLGRRFDLDGLASVAKHLASFGYSPLVVDETQDYAKRVRVSVCRAVVPGLLPLSFGVSAAGRLAGLAVRLRAAGLSPLRQEVTSLPPHPFA